MKNFKKILVYVLLIVIAIGAGSVFAKIGSSFEPMSWLSKGPNFGFDPFNLNLIVLDITLGLNIHLTVAHIILFIILIFAAPKIVKALVG